MKPIRWIAFTWFFVASLLAVGLLPATAPLQSFADDAAALESPAACPSPDVTLTPSTDSYVDEQSPTATHGLDTIVQVGRSEFLEEAFALVRFNLSSIPAGSVIHCATFEAYLAGADFGNEEIKVHRIMGNWNSNTVTWNTRPSVSGTSYGTTNVGTRLWLPLVRK